MVLDISRFRFCEKWVDESDRVFWDQRKPYRYRAFSDNAQHLVRAGETLATIAGRHFRPLPRAAGLWWVIADFQPVPIVDPTVSLAVGTTLILPSHDTLFSYIMNESRRTESRL